MDETSGPVIGVVGGSGGVGASCFAAVLAVVAGPSVLVDLDCTGGGADVLLGVESRPGARWSGLHLDGGRLDPGELLAGLPRAGPCAVLAADTAELDPDAVHEVVTAAACAGPVVLDLPRAAGPARAAALQCADLVVVLARTDVSGLVAAHAMVAGLPPVPVGVVVRRGDVEPDEAAALIGAALLGVLPVLGAGRFVLDADRPPRSAARVAAGVWAGLRVPVARVAS